MAVPSEQEFEKTIYLLNSCHAGNELKEKIIPAFVNVPLNPEAVEQVIVSMVEEELKIRDEKVKALRQSKAYKWFESQAPIKKISRRTRSPRPSEQSFLSHRVRVLMEYFSPLSEERIDRHYLRYQKRCESSDLSIENKNVFASRLNSWPQRMDRLTSEMRYSVSSIPRGLNTRLDIIKALSNYYHTELWKRLYEEQKKNDLKTLKKLGER